MHERIPMIFGDEKPVNFVIDGTRAETDKITFIQMMVKDSHPYSISRLLQPIDYNFIILKTYTNQFSASLSTEAICVCFTV